MPGFASARGSGSRMSDAPAAPDARPFPLGQSDRFSLWPPLRHRFLWALKHAPSLAAAPLWPWPPESCPIRVPPWSREVNSLGAGRLCLGVCHLERHWKAPGLGRLGKWGQSQYRPHRLLQSLSQCDEALSSAWASRGQGATVWASSLLTRGEGAEGLLGAWPRSRSLWLWVVVCSGQVTSPLSPGSSPA